MREFFDSSVLTACFSRGSSAARVEPQTVGRRKEEAFRQRGSFSGGSLLGHERAASQAGDPSRAGSAFPPGDPQSLHPDHSRRGRVLRDDSEDSRAGFRQRPASMMPCSCGARPRRKRRPSTLGTLSTSRLWRPNWPGGFAHHDLAFRCGSPSGSGPRESCRELATAPQCPPDRGRPLRWRWPVGRFHW